MNIIPRIVTALAVVGLLAFTPVVHAAKPQAPGAPGAIHVSILPEA